MIQSQFYFEKCIIWDRNECPDQANTTPCCDLCPAALHDHTLFTRQGAEKGIPAETKNCPDFGRIKTGLDQREGYFPHNGNVQMASFSNI